MITFYTLTKLTNIINKRNKLYSKVNITDTDS